MNHFKVNTPHEIHPKYGQIIIGYDTEDDPLTGVLGVFIRYDKYGNTIMARLDNSVEVCFKFNEIVDIDKLDQITKNSLCYHQ